VLSFGLRKFRHDTSIVETCCQLSSAKVDAQSVITGPSSASYVENTRHGRRLVYHTDRLLLSAARCRRAGSSATAEKACCQVSCSFTACDWMTGRKRSHSNSNQLTDKWGACGDNVATRPYYYWVMRCCCIGMTSSRVAKPV